MKVSQLLSGSIAVLGAFASSEATTSGSTSKYIPASTVQTDILAAKGLLNLAINVTTSGHYKTSQCQLSNIAVRREWSTLSKEERRNYIDAMLCLQSKPTKDPSFAPGARTRYDDFLAVHINQTLFIHGTANFLSWHRYFTWALEQALRNECGYTGYHPYWNWGKYAFDPINSPIFDGSDYSMSGNGEYEPHNCTEALPTKLNCIPPGPGGGCVKTGPFKDYVVNMGPVAPTLAEPEVKPSKSNLAYNPRCLKRDVSVWVSSNWTRDIDSYDLITQNNDILSFQNTMQGDFPRGFYGVHTGGHFTIGGDPGGDLYASPGDPAFFLHHAQIDRTWWIWQTQDLKNRQYALAGVTALLDPNSPKGTLNDPVIMGTLAQTRPIRDLMSTLDGPFCYIYI